ncbi:MAG: hypothetical protein ACRYG7_11485 [Janthinobacterium lividum]
MTGVPGVPNASTLPGQIGTTIGTTPNTTMPGSFTTPVGATPSTIYSTPMGTTSPATDAVLTPSTLPYYFS